MSAPEVAQLGMLIRRFRLAAGLSQEELAERSGLSVRGVSDLERGQRRIPRLETIRMLADVGLHAHGYRTLTSKPGHHQTAIQTLSLTLGLQAQVIVRLDALRKQRNLTEYTGDTVPEATVAECLSQAEALYGTATAWLRAHRPELI